MSRKWLRLTWNVVLVAFVARRVVVWLLVWLAQSYCWIVAAIALIFLILRPPVLRPQILLLLLIYVPFVRKLFDRIHPPIGPAYPFDAAVLVIDGQAAGPDELADAGSNGRDHARP